MAKEGSRADVPKALNRLRKDLKKEVARDSTLPRDIEQSVFGFFDTLDAMEASGKGHEPVEGEHGSPPQTP